MLITNEEIDAFLEEVEVTDIVPVYQIADALGEDPVVRSNPLPWSKAHGLFDMRPGEMTVWAGQNGVGKSRLMGQIILWMLPYTRAFIASMEMTLRQTVIRICDQARGGESSGEFRRSLARWTRLNEKGDARLYVYDVIESVVPARLVGVCKIAAKRFGCQHIVVDSLTSLALPPQDQYQAQIQFVDQLRLAAKSTGCHIHLVAHLRKGEDDRKPPTKWDIRGAGQVSDLADNVVLMYRNPAREPEDGEPEVFLEVAKQRHHAWEGRIALWKHPSGQFLGTPGRGAMEWPGPGELLPWEVE